MDDRAMDLGIHFSSTDARSSLSSCALHRSPPVFKPMDFDFPSSAEARARVDSPLPPNVLPKWRPARKSPPAAQPTARSPRLRPTTSTSMSNVGPPSPKSTMLPSRSSTLLILCPPNPPHLALQMVPHKGLLGRWCWFLHRCVRGRVI